MIWVGDQNVGLRSGIENCVCLVKLKDNKRREWGKTLKNKGQVLGSFNMTTKRKDNILQLEQRLKSTEKVIICIICIYIFIDRHTHIHTYKVTKPRLPLPYSQI